MNESENIDMLKKLQKLEKKQKTEIERWLSSYSCEQVLFTGKINGPWAHLLGEGEGGGASWIIVTYYGRPISQYAKYHNTLCLSLQKFA